jgi:nickel/cobalt exporter
LANLFLTVNNQPLALRAESNEVQTENGAGNLPTLKIKWNLLADLPNTEKINQVRFENKNYAERLGWNEIVVNQIGSVKIFDSTAFGSGITDELKAYPQETLDAPLVERTRGTIFFFKWRSSRNCPTFAKPRRTHQRRRSARPIRRIDRGSEITFPVIAFGLLLAFGFGAMHALSPGHGKAVVGAYLVGSRGTPKHAVFLGLTVTITHTLGVFALGIITLFASEYILPERLMPFLSFVSGLLVLYIGLTMFKSRLFASLGWENAGHHHHGAHSHSHDDEHSHESRTSTFARARRIYAHARRAHAFASAAGKRFVEKSARARHFRRTFAVSVGARFDVVGD